MYVFNVLCKQLFISIKQCIICNILLYSYKFICVNDLIYLIIFIFFLPPINVHHFLCDIYFSISLDCALQSMSMGSQGLAQYQLFNDVTPVFKRMPEESPICLETLLDQILDQASASESLADAEGLLAIAIG